MGNYSLTHTLPKNMGMDLDMKNGYSAAALVPVELSNQLVSEAMMEMIPF
jgi:hypothetical protein